MLFAPFVAADHLVFGSFQSASNAGNWAAKLSNLLGQPIKSMPTNVDGATWYRVQSQDLDREDFTELKRRASLAGIASWRLVDSERISERVEEAEVAEGQHPNRTTPRIAPPAGVREQGKEQQGQEQQAQEQRGQEKVREFAAPAMDSTGQTEWEWDLGLQGRGFFNRGDFGQERGQGSASVEMTYYRTWDNAKQSVTFTPFGRWDSLDSKRSHWDVRELFYSRVGDSWDFHVGAKRVFWGVTEFHHLVDIVNQTDILENIDGEDKLGQPMVQLSLVRDWGIVDLYALTGFREREFPGTDGRLRLPLRVRGDGAYESGAEQNRLDGAIRWSHSIANIEFAVHHFSGTSREPLLLPQVQGADPTLLAYYPVIDQTGLEAQALHGDWAFKLEGFTRSGFGDRYAAANIGFERTVVGAFGSRTDLGVVVEYMFDERNEDAFNTIYERDVALGARLSFNDFADTQALIGIILDTQRDEQVFSVEASRQLSESWALNFETRIFAGGKRVTPGEILTTLSDPDFKSSWLQRDDYLQLEFIKYL